MSRIQEILAKAERDGTARRTQTAAVVPSAAPGAFVPQPSIQPRPSPGPARSELVEPRVDGTSALDGPFIASAVAAPVAAPVGVTIAPAAETRTAVPTLHPLLVAAIDPHSAAAERYRSVRTRISHREETMPVRTMMITSPGAGEGKSITAANLALTMAQELQRRVVIVEADLRKPALHQLFGLPSGPGLADYLTGAADLNGVMKFLPDHNLTVIPAGLTPMNPAELLGSTAMRRLLDQLRTRFDRVILDTPPVLPLADVAILAPLVDGTVMVVRAGYTPKPAIENALRAFDSTRLLGIVLNESGLEQDYRYEAPRH